MAEALGFDEAPVREKVSTPKPEPSPEPVEGPVPQKSPEAEPLEPIPFWRPVRVERRRDAEVSSRRPTVEALDESALLPPSAEELPECPPIVPWPRLWRALGEILRTPRPRQEIDIAALVDRWGRGERVARLPRLEGLGHARLALIVDRDRRLLPYWEDQADLVRRLIRELGRPSLRFLPPPGRGTSHRAQLPQEGEILLALSDLGSLGSSSDEEPWRRLGRELHRTRRRAIALSPCPESRWGGEAIPGWQLVDWSAPDRAEATANVLAAVSDRAQEAVLARLSMAVRIERGLLREACRLVPGADLGTESEVCADPRVDASAFPVIRVLPEAVRDLQQSFAGCAAEEKRKWVDTLLRWHGPGAGVPPEVWAWEVAHLLACNTEVEAIGEQVVQEAAELFDRMASTLVGESSGSDLLSGIESFVGRMASSLPSEATRHRAVREPLGRCFAALLRRRPDAELPRGVTPEMLPDLDPAQPTRRYGIRQHGNQLTVGPAGEERPGTWVFDVSSQRPVVAVEVGFEAPKALGLSSGTAQIEIPEAETLQLTTDREQVLLEAFEQPTWATAAGRDGFGLWAAFEVEGIEQRMRWIPPGRFLMGSPEDEEGRWEGEGPQHPVELREGFWMAETLCTQELWETVMGENPSRFRSPNRPVENVSWEDCQAFLDRLNYRYPDLELDLPSEAEWEFACRAGTHGATWLGDLEIRGANSAPRLGPIAWYGGNSGVGFELEDGADSSNWPEKEQAHELAGTRKVGQKDPNLWGLYDILGNVEEWCWDFWGDYTAELQIDPEGPEDGGGRVLRGGSWISGARFVRAACRGGADPGCRNVDVGFRLSRGPWDRGAMDRGAVPSSRRGAPPERGRAVFGSLVEAPDVDRSRSQGRSRRIRAWVERLGWAVDGGLDEYGRWAAIEVKGVQHRLRWIYPGRFWMGSPDTEAGRYEDESPRHEVTLTQGFWLGEVPCTQALWEAVMEQNPSEFRSPSRPVEQVSWEDCQEFFESLEGLVPGFAGRLPTEAQWEYACRAGTEEATWLRDLEILGKSNAPILDQIAWYAGNSGVDFDLAEGWDSSEWPEKQFPHTKAGTRETDQKPANPCGLRDMLGNVFEWCHDSWNVEDPYPDGPRVDPLGTDGRDRVFRGGSWLSNARHVRAAYRGGHDPGYRDHDVGFRLSRGPQETSGAEPKEKEESRPDRRGTSRGVASKRGARDR